MASPIFSAAPLVVTPLRTSAQDATRAYQQAAGGGEGAGGEGFGDVLSRAVQGVVQTGQAAEAQAAQAIAGQGDLTTVVQAVSRAELTLQTATAIRDRVVQAYQDIMRMPI